MNIHLQAAQATRLRLRETGFSPIPVNGKRPLITGWQKLAGATAEDIAGWNASHPDHTNTGALTARMPVCDLDILDPDAVAACEQLIRDRFGETGPVLVRIGNAPKRAIPFQTAKAYAKIAVNLIAPNGDTNQKIELLCDGQQVVVDGIHPDTHKPYTWFGGFLGDVKLVELPHLNEAEARMLVRDLVELLVKEHGYKVAPTRPRAVLANGNGTDSEYQTETDPGEDWERLFDNILQGADLHDSTRDLAAKVITAGMKAGPAVNFIRGLMARSRAPRDDRYFNRLHDIPKLVSSAEQKFADSEYTAEEQAQPIEILSSGDFVLNFVPPDYLVDGLLQEGFLYSLTGATGAGKTAITLRLAASTALGGVFAGRSTKQRRVLYLAAENPDDVRMRWIALAQQMDFVVSDIGVFFVEGVFSISQMATRLKEEADKHGGDFGLVIIDTSPVFYEGDNENDRTQQGAHAKLLRELINLIPGKPAVIANCHPVKNAAADNLVPAGGGSFLNQVDGNLTAAKTDSTTELHTQGKFRGVEFAPMHFLIKTVTHQDLKDNQGRLIPTVICEWISDREKENIADQCERDEDAVLKHIADNPKASQASIATAMGWKLFGGEPHKSKAGRRIKALVKQKLIKETRAGRYQLTPNGRSVLDGDE